SGRVLLFPGDAQEFSWRSWHELSWTVRAADGSVVPVTAADLLRRTVLYKVSHHGSVPGTPREKGLDLMVSPELAALVPVDGEMPIRRRWNMPSRAVLARLKEVTQGRLICSDQGVPDEPLSPAATNWLAGVRKTDLFIDVVVPKGARGRDE